MHTALSTLRTQKVRRLTAASLDSPPTPAVFDSARVGEAAEGRRTLESPRQCGGLRPPYLGVAEKRGVAKGRRILEWHKMGDAAADGRRTPTLFAFCKDDRAESTHLLARLSVIRKRFHSAHKNATARVSQSSPSK